MYSISQAIVLQSFSSLAISALLAMIVCSLTPSTIIPACSLLVVLCLMSTNRNLGMTVSNCWSAWWYVALKIQCPIQTASIHLIQSINTKGEELQGAVADVQWQRC